VVVGVVPPRGARGAALLLWPPSLEGSCPQSGAGACRPRSGRGGRRACASFPGLLPQPSVIRLSPDATTLLAKGGFFLLPSQGWLPFWLPSLEGSCPRSGLRVAVRGADWGLPLGLCWGSGVLLRWGLTHRQSLSFGLIPLRHELRRGSCRGSEPLCRCLWAGAAPGAERSLTFRAPRRCPLTGGASGLFPAAPGLAAVFVAFFGLVASLPCLCPMFCFCLPVFSFI